MSRFLYIADTHLGAHPMGYFQQPAYPERLPELLAALDACIADLGGVDFILHGGDMLDALTPDNLRAAARLFRLRAPLYLCLGNHDLTAANARATWLQAAPHLFATATPNYSIATPDCAVHVVTTHWCEQPYYWREELAERLLDDESAWLEQAIAAHPQPVQLIVTHSPVFGLPPEQTGEAQPIHPPRDAFRDQLLGLVSRHPAVRCVLGAHNHLNLHVVRNGVHFVTASSFVEAPFECKLFEVSATELRMTTLPLAARAAFDWSYDFDKTFVQGRAGDRSLHALFNQQPCQERIDKEIKRGTE